MLSIFHNKRINDTQSLSMLPSNRFKRKWCINDTCAYRPFSCPMTTKNGIHDVFSVHLMMGSHPREKEALLYELCLEVSTAVISPQQVVLAPLVNITWIKSTMYTYVYNFESLRCLTLPWNDQSIITLQTAADGARTLQFILFTSCLRVESIKILNNGLESFGFARDETWSQW